MNRLSRSLSLTLASALFYLLWSCSASNCPLESTVLCNYGFYDSEGTAVTYTDTISVTTLLPGMKTVYIYRKLGYPTMTLNSQDSSYIESGYSETISEVRRDTLLRNKLTNVSTMSLPMQYFSSSDTLIISYSSISNKDTLYISHDSYSHIDLPECGTHRFHTLREIRSTDSGIFGVEISNPRVNYEGRENVKIYFNGTAN